MRAVRHVGDEERERRHELVQRDERCRQELQGLMCFAAGCVLHARHWPGGAELRL
jgi:hypothetical protein